MAVAANAAEWEGLVGTATGDTASRHRPVVVQADFRFTSVS